MTDELKNLFNKKFTEYSKVQGVIGVDIGNRYDEDHQRLNELCVRIHVDGLVGTIETDHHPLVQFLFLRSKDMNPAGIISNNSARRREMNPIQPGISVGYLGTGTLGLICFDNINKKLVLLTCQHVVGTSARNTPIFQPGRRLDGGRKRHQVGSLIRVDPLGDAAIFRFNKRRGHELKQYHKDQEVLIQSSRFAKIGDRLSKSGRTTGVTHGIVDGIGIYMVAGKKIEGFRIVPEDPQNQGNEEISFGGDSGAIWYDSVTHEGVGLLYAGERSTMPPYAEFTLAQHLPRVLENLNISLTQHT